MAICYAQDPISARNNRSTGFDPSRVDPNKGYLRHYENYLLLKFMLSNGTTHEKMDASRELVVCERKLKWHEQHSDFDKERVEAEVKRLRARWSR